MTPTPPARRATLASRLTLTALLCGGLLAGCGGGTSQVERFVPERILVFGDDLSVLTADGKKYSTNFADDNNVIACGSSPIWVQTLASQYGMVFAECNPNAQANPKARMLAVVGGTSDTLATEVQGFLAGDGIRSTDMATVLVGMNDILQAYASYPIETEADLTIRMEAAGARVAEQVNALAAGGARVIVSTAPDMGLTPFALQENIDHGDTRSRLLTRLTNAFNKSMRLNLTNDGSRIGLILMDDLVRAMVRVPAAYGIANTTKAVCSLTAPLPDCTSNTLLPADTVPTPTITSYLWADATRPASTAQGQLGVQAARRAAANPF